MHQTVEDMARDLVVRIERVIERIDRGRLGRERDPELLRLRRTRQGERRRDERASAPVCHVRLPAGPQGTLIKTRRRCNGALPACRSLVTRNDRPSAGGRGPQASLAKAKAKPAQERRGLPRLAGGLRRGSAVMVSRAGEEIRQVL